MVVDFRPSRRPTLGVEWELGLVDARTGDLVSAAAEVVEEARAGYRPASRECTGS